VEIQLVLVIFKGKKSRLKPHSRRSWGMRLRSIKFYLELRFRWITICGTIRSGSLKQIWWYFLGATPDKILNIIATSFWGYLKAKNMFKNN